MSLRDTLPETSALEQAAKCKIFDVTGTEVDFGSIYATQKTVVIFIRHFFCGSCKMYIEDLNAVTEPALEAADAKIVVVGCGEWIVLKNYLESTKFKGAIYADPTRKLYHALGMDIENTATAPAGQKPSYVKLSYTANLFKSIKDGLSAPSLIGKQGNVAQLGGDFILGPGNQCTLAHRMQNTEDHIEVKDLMKAAGVTM